MQRVFVQGATGIAWTSKLAGPTVLRFGSESAGENHFHVLLRGRGRITERAQAVFVKGGASPGIGVRDRVTGCIEYWQQSPVLLPNGLAIAGV